MSSSYMDEPIRRRSYDDRDRDRDRDRERDYYRERERESSRTRYRDRSAEYSDRYGVDREDGSGRYNRDRDRERERDYRDRDYHDRDYHDREYRDRDYSRERERERDRSRIDRDRRSHYGGENDKEYGGGGYNHGSSRYADDDVYNKNNGNDEDRSIHSYNNSRSHNQKYDNYKNRQGTYNEYRGGGDRDGGGPPRSSSSNRGYPVPPVTSSSDYDQYRPQSNGRDMDKYGRDSGSGRGNGYGHGDGSRGGGYKQNNNYGQPQPQQQSYHQRRDGGRSGRGGGERGGSSYKPTSALSNLIMADISPNFRFYLYGINVSDGKGCVVDTRRRRQELFMLGLFHPEKGLFSHLKPKDMESRRRGIFFEGSYCFSSQPLEGLDRDSLPRYLVVGKDHDQSNSGGIDGEMLPISDNGDTLQVMNVQGFKAPQAFYEDGRLEELPGSSSPITATLDGRCATCTSCFRDVAALLSHCRVTGHVPATQADVEVPQSQSNGTSLTHEISNGANASMSTTSSSAMGGTYLKHSNKEVFLSYCNVALQRAMGERMARWGREYIDPKSYQEPEDRRGNKLGVKVFRAYTCEFGMHRPVLTDEAKKETPTSAPNIDNAGLSPKEEGNAKLTLMLTVDLRAKLLRTKSVLDALCDGRDPHTVRFDAHQQDQALKQWRNEIVICVYDKKCYAVVDLLFDQSPSSLAVEGLGISHAQYFMEKKKIHLKYPDVKPVVAVLGRNNSTIYLPPELVCGNELESRLKTQLPSIASFRPKERHDAIEEMKRFLRPGAQKTRGLGGGLLPALGIMLKDERMNVPVKVLALPTIVAAGVRVPEHKGHMWAPLLSKAQFNVDPGRAVTLNVVVVYHRNLRNTFGRVYERLMELVNRFNANYQFAVRPFACVEAGDMDDHWGSVETYFRQGGAPDNVFVLDFSKPPNRSSSDPAYSVVKQMLGQAGYLSQFVNFNTYDHGTPRDLKKSTIILQGVARQILSKCGVRIWWVDLPRSIPLPAVFVGVDVLQAQRRIDSKSRKGPKESCVAVVVQVLRGHGTKEDYDHDSTDIPNHTEEVEIYSETARRVSGQEMELGKVIARALCNAMRNLKVDPRSCVIWRDGVVESTIEQAAASEIPEVREVLSPDTSIGYIVCQKRIATKFLSPDGNHGMPVGALVDSLQGAESETFYINGTSPPYSTPKPVRYVVAHRDIGLSAQCLPELSWGLCHDYPNWTGPVKLPSPIQMAHKLAEQAGSFIDCGDSVNAEAFTNKIHFL